MIYHLIIIVKESVFRKTIKLVKYKDINKDKFKHIDNNMEIHINIMNMDNNNIKWKNQESHKHILIEYKMYKIIIIIIETWRKIIKKIWYM